MTDAKLGELLQAYGIARATQWISGGPLDEIESARAAIVAHVREREVELMALAMWAAPYRDWYRGWSVTARDWKTAPARQRGNNVRDARALRDAFDQAGGMGA